MVEVIPHFTFISAIIMNRILRGTLGGALFGLIGALVLPAIVMLLSFTLVEVHPHDLEDELSSSILIVMFSAVCGLTLGTLAGLAASLPTRGVPFLRCCIAIAIPTAIVRLLTAPVPKFSEPSQFYFSYAACLAAAMIATGVLIVVGFKNHPSADPSSFTSTQKTSP